MPSATEAVLLGDLNRVADELLLLLSLDLAPKQRPDTDAHGRPQVSSPGATCNASSANDENAYDLDSGAQPPHSRPVYSDQVASHDLDSRCGPEATVHPDLVGFNSNPNSDDSYSANLTDEMASVITVVANGDASAHLPSGVETASARLGDFCASCSAARRVCADLISSPDLAPKGCAGANLEPQNDGKFKAARGDQVEATRRKTENSALEDKAKIGTTTLTFATKRASRAQADEFRRRRRILTGDTSRCWADQNNLN